MPEALGQERPEGRPISSTAIMASLGAIAAFAGIFNLERSNTEEEENIALIIIMSGFAVCFIAGVIGTLKNCNCLPQNAALDGARVEPYLGNIRQV